MSRTILIGFLGILAALGLGAYLLSQQGDPEGLEASTSVAEALGGDTVGYARAEQVRSFSFPEDHGPHPTYKTEWWYFTGNLDTEDGRHFGYQFTLFRVALMPPDSGKGAEGMRAVGDASWRTNQLYMAHFTVSDVRGETLHAFERFSRGGAGLAGAQADPFRVWLEDWSAESAGGEELFPLRLRAAEGEVALDLTLRPGKPMVLQGERGLSRKGPEPGNASYYYSFTRLPTKGAVVLQGDTLAVEGTSWMDREWSTSALGEGQEGWDWFALQLSSGWDLMYYQIREKGGTPSRFSEGVLVGTDGDAQSISREEVEVEVRDRWESPHGGTYPARWTLRVPSEDISLDIQPYLADQELDVSVRYWEGAVRVEGTAGGESVTGEGFVELTGYADGEGEGRGAGALP